MYNEQEMEAVKAELKEWKDRYGSIKAYYDIVLQGLQGTIEGTYSNKEVFNTWYNDCKQVYIP